MYRNFIFDLYGTLVDIHTNEYKPSLWKKMALFYSFQGAAYTGKELRCRYRQLETAARKAPSPYAYPEICAAVIFRILYAEKGIQPSESLLTATGQFFRIESLHTLQCYPASIDTLQKLHANGCGVYLLSNAQRFLRNTNCVPWGFGNCSTAFSSPRMRAAASRIPPFSGACLTATV